MTNDFTTRLSFPTFKNSFCIGGFWLNPRHVMGWNLDYNTQLVMRYELKFMYEGSTSNLKLVYNSNIVYIKVLPNTGYGDHTFEVTITGVLKAGNRDAMELFIDACMRS